MKPHRILPEAAAELEHASRWYAQEREGLGLDLIADYRERLKLLLEVPHAGALVGNTAGGSEIRRFRLARFSRYAIVMAVIHGVPTVLAFEHSSRRPGYWRERLK